MILFFNLRQRSIAPLFYAALAFILLFALIGPVYAGEVSIGDKSFDNEVAALSELESTADFGQQIINWIAYGHPKGMEGISGSTGDGTLLGHLAFTLSAISLIVMAALAALGGINYTIHTANRGMPGGQIISSFWMPIRISVATILLVPIAGGVGYSTIHLGVIKVAEMGSAHAGFLAGQALDYIGTKGVYSPPRPGGGSQVVNGLLLSELCKQYVNANENLDESNGVYSERIGRLIKYEKKPKGFMRTGWMEKENYCGAMTFTGENALPGALGPLGNRATGQQVAKLLATEPPKDMDELIRPKYDLNEDEVGSELATYVDDVIRPKVADIAAKLMSDQEALASLIETGSGQSSAQEDAFKSAQLQAHASLAAQSDSINSLISEYNEYVHEKLVADALAISSGNGEWVEEIKEAGWPAFGMIFWHASQLQKKINERMKAYFPIVTKPHPSDGYEDDERWHILVARLYDAQAKASKKNPEEDFNLESLVDAGDPNWVTSGGQRWLARFFARIFIIPTADDANAVTRLQSTGYTILGLSEMAVFGTIAVKSFAAGAEMSAQAVGRGMTAQTDGWVKWVPFAGNVAQGAATVAEAAFIGMATGIKTAIFELVKYFRFLLGPVIIAGFALAIVLPTIPAMFWLLGVISYMLFFVQCLLVSTFWLAAHGTAEGQGWGSEHTRQGYLLMLGLYLSPILRVAGFAAMLLVIMPVGVLMQWMLNYVLGVAATNIVMSPFMTIGSLIIVTIFAYSAFVRIFALPSELFEHGLRWINGGQEVTGDSHAEGHSRILIAQFSSQFSQGQMRRQSAPEQSQQRHLDMNS